MTTGFLTVCPLVFMVAFVLIIPVFLFNLSARIRRHDSEQGRRNELLNVDADGWIVRLSSEILWTNPEVEQVKKPVARASERRENALSQAGSASTVGQAELAKDVAVKGLYYMREARRQMGEPEGPPLPELGG